MKMGKQQWLSSTQPTALFERGVGVLWGVNMTITDRLPGESCMRPALQLVVVGSLLCYTNKDDFLMPQVKMRYVIVVLTLRQVYFRLWTMSCVTASSEMCRAQRWDLDDSCCAGAIDGVQGQGWIMGMWQRSNLWVQAKESVCGFSSEQHWNHVSQVEATSAAQTAQKGNAITGKNIGDSTTIAVAFWVVVLWKNFCKGRPRCACLHQEGGDTQRSPTGLVSTVTWERP